LYSEDIAIAKQDYFLAHTISHGDFGKMPKYASAKTKLLFYGLSNAQIESIKGKKQLTYTTFYSTYSGYISK
jgi:Cu(I)/Ag(I) efflux system membrane fusion protein